MPRSRSGTDITNMRNGPRAFYLEDGQTEPRISDWQARLSESREAVLSVLSDAAKKTVFDGVHDAWQVLLPEFCTLWQLILKDVSTCAARIPQPRGFFVGTEERAPAYREICRLLELLDKRMQALHLLLLRLLRLRTRTAEILDARFDTEMLFCEIIAAAQRNGDGETEAQATALRTAWEGRVADGAALLEVLDTVEQRLSELCMRTLPAFYERTLSLADMEHEGAACDPVALASLCGELRAAMEGGFN